MFDHSFYVETTVIGYIAARQQSNASVAQRQAVSRYWWDQRHQYRTVVSQLVIDECTWGNAETAQDQLRLLINVETLALSNDVRLLAEELIARNGVPASEPRDALHIAIAAVHGIQHFLTWSEWSTPNSDILFKVSQILNGCGYECPSFCSPDNWMKSGN